MNLLFWGLTISVAGKVLLVIGVLKVHTKIEHEHRIDGEVLKTFKLERMLTLGGLLLIAAGYTLEIIFYGFTPFLTCFGDECLAAIAAGLSQ